MIIDLLRHGRRKVLTWLDKISFQAGQMVWEEAICRIAGSDKDAFFIEIGAWDGIGEDFSYSLIKKHKISGILIEPQQDQLHKLRENYAYHNKIFFENVAIAEKDCIKPLFFISLNSKVLSPAHATLKKEVVKEEIACCQQKNILPPGDYSQYILSKPVQCLSLSTVIEKYRLNKIDILQIDTEGYEYEILKSIPFDKVKPRAIRYEYIHLSRTEYQKSISILKRNGYSITLHGPDILALKKIKNMRKMVFLNCLVSFAKNFMYKFTFWTQGKV